MEWRCSDGSSAGGQRGGLQRAPGDKERESGSVCFSTQVRLWVMATMCILIVFLGMGALPTYISVHHMYAWCSV